jgi:ABC-2 type transport system ATP-binding protein
MVDKGWVLLELHRDAQTLEDVFRSLTIGDERRNRSLAAAAEGDDEEDETDEDEEGEDEEESERSADEDQKVAKDERS